MSFFDHPTSQPAEPVVLAPVAPQAARTEEQVAEAFYAKPEPLPPEELSPELQALRAADPGRVMFGDVSSYSSAGIVDALTAYGIEGRDAEVEHRAWAGILADLEVPPAEATALVKLALIDVDEGTAAGWGASAADALVREFGANANTVLADAKLLIARDPRLGRFLDASGLGNHPEVVLQAARIARSQIASGKLKRKG